MDDNHGHAHVVDDCPAIGRPVWYASFRNLLLLSAKKLRKSTLDVVFRFRPVEGVIQEAVPIGALVAKALLTKERDPLSHTHHPTPLHRDVRVQLRRILVLHDSDS